MGSPPGLTWDDPRTMSDVADPISERRRTLAEMLAGHSGEATAEEARAALEAARRQRHENVIGEPRTLGFAVIKGRGADQRAAVSRRRHRRRAERRGHRHFDQHAHPRTGRQGRAHLDVRDRADRQVARASRPTTATRMCWPPTRTRSWPDWRARHGPQTAPLQADRQRCGLIRSTRP